MSSAKQPPCTSRPFFNLPYDIREQIYGFIETDALPPLSEGAAYAGFVLSCKLAAEELSYVATQHCRHYLEELKRRSKQRVGHMINILEPEQAPAGQSNPFAHLRRIKVEVYLGDHGLSTHFRFQDSESWCDMFHPLFGPILDDVHIHFKAPIDYQMRLEEFEFINIYSMVLRLFDLIENPGPPKTDMIPARLPPPQHTANVTHFLQEFESQVNGFTRAKRVGAKSVCFSWDCRPKAQLGSPVAMMGPLWRYTVPFRDSVGTDGETHHRLHNVGSSAGEVRLASSARWAPTKSSLRERLYYGTYRVIALRMKDLDSGEAAMVVGKAPKEQGEVA